MKYYNLTYILACLSMLVLACEDRLEIEPAQSISGNVAITSEVNIENILIGAYDESGQGPSHGGQVQVISDLIGTEDQISWGGTFLAPAEIINRSILPDNGFVSGFWNNAYEVINQTNIVLDNLAVVTSDAAKKDRIEGEARFLRALNYFELLSHFSSGNDAVPLRTVGILDYATDLSLARSDVPAVYQLIISDLQAASNLLPESNGFFADKYAAEALLARIYLYQGNFAAARDAANNVIQNSGHALSADYAAAFNHDEDNEEDLFAFQVTSQTGTNQLITFYASEGNGGRGGDITVTDNYVALFGNPEDQRSTFFYDSPENGGRLTSKYTNQFGNVPILRLAEMYLIRAEANLEEGTATGATPLEDVNTIRTRSGAASLVSISKDLILVERQLELAFEGFFIHDIKRTQGTIGGMPHSDPKLVLPIPQSEIDTNPSIQQNPSY